jgi:nicotinamidase/pyrazinamidase
MQALLLIDIQNDFLPGGSLAVPNGDKVVPIANELIPKYDLVFATQDWHPADHLSFTSQHPGRKVGEVIHLDGLEQILWPDHCVQNTFGAQFAPQLNHSRIQHVIQKGTDRTIDSYSGFFDNARRKQTPLESRLRAHKVETLHLVGLATDYCVKATALDAVDLRFHTVVILAGIRGVELHPGDCQRAIEQMRSAGVQIQ